MNQHIRLVCILSCCSNPLLFWFPLLLHLWRELYLSIHSCWNQHTQTQRKKMFDSTQNIKSESLLANTYFSLFLCYHLLSFMLIFDSFCCTFPCFYVTICFLELYCSGSELINLEYKFLNRAGNLSFSRKNLGTNLNYYWVIC